MTNDVRNEGGCLCGAIRYNLRVPTEQIIQCHCRDCQRASGASFTPNTPVPTDSFELLSGEPKVFSQVVDSGRTLHRFFCGDCGSPLYSRRENTPESTTLRVGSLDDSSQATVVMNIWTSSAQPWSMRDPSLTEHTESIPT